MKTFFKTNYIPALFLSFCLFTLDKDSWHSKWAFLLSVLSAFLSFQVYKALRSKLAGLSCAWTLLSGILVFSYLNPIYLEVLKTPFFGTFNENVAPVRTENPMAYHFYFDSAYATFSFLALVITTLFLTPRHHAKILISLSLVSITSSILIILHAISGKLLPGSTGGFFDQGSMEGCILAVLYPIVLHLPTYQPDPKKRNFFQDFSLISVFSIPIAIFLLLWKAETTLPIVTLYAVLAVDFLVSFKSLRYKEREITFQMPEKIITILGSLIPVSYIGYLVNPNFFSSSNRTLIYKMAWEFQSQKWYLILFGWGNGTWGTWAQALQKDQNIFPGNYFTFMHSDWAQIFFEQGIIGFLLILFTGLLAFKRALNLDSFSWIASSLFGYGVMMLFNYPAHLAFHGFVGVYLVTLCLRAGHN